MNGTINDIFNMYKQEVDVLDAFNQISKEKANVVKRNDIKLLNSIIRGEEALLMKLAYLANKKQKALENFKEENSIKKKVSLRVLKKHLTKDELKQFNKLSDRFTQSIITQEGYKVENEKLINARLGYLDSLLDEIEKENTRYTKEEVLVDKKV